MQSLETSFFLIALGRYPHALTICAAAIESAMQAADIGAKETDALQELLKKARKSSKAIQEFDKHCSMTSAIRGIELSTAASARKMIA